MMNRATITGAALTALLTSGAGTEARAEPKRYVLDPNHLTLAFLVDHIGYAKVLGRFREAEGSFVFDEETRELSQVRISVRTASIFTNQEQRDRHLRSADFLHCEKYPEMTFQAAGVRLDATGKGRIEGQLTLLGVSRPLTLAVSWNKSATSPLEEEGRRPYVLGASARGSFKRSDFGMTYGVANALVGDEVEILIELEARRQ